MGQNWVCSSCPAHGWQSGSSFKLRPKERVSLLSFKCLWKDAVWVAVGRVSRRIKAITEWEGGGPGVKARYWAPGPQVSPHTLFGSHSHPAGGGMQHERLCKAAHPPAGLGSAAASRWWAAAAGGHADSHREPRAGWQHTERCGWFGNFSLQTDRVTARSSFRIKV